MHSNPGMAIGSGGNVGLSHTPRRDDLEENRARTRFDGATVDLRRQRSRLSSLGVVARAPLGKNLASGIDQTRVDLGCKVTDVRVTGADHPLAPSLLICL